MSLFGDFVSITFKYLSAIVEWCSIGTIGTFTNPGLKGTTRRSPHVSSGPGALSTERCRAHHPRSTCAGVRGGEAASRSPVRTRNAQGWENFGDFGGYMMCMSGICIYVILYVCIYLFNYILVYLFVCLLVCLSVYLSNSMILGSVW